MLKNRQLAFLYTLTQYFKTCTTGFENALFGQIDQFSKYKTNWNEWGLLDKNISELCANCCDTKLV